LFIGTHGVHPVAGLAQGSDGNFYGTTAYGGANGNGTVFRVTSAGAFTTLISFNGTNGGRPVAGLTPGNDGNFYGTTCRGGADDIGTVFQITPAGTLTTLVSFGGANGGNPMGPLALGTNGNFYGTTSQGGNLGLNSGAGFGTVFEVTTAGVLSTLANFSGGNGANPVGGLVQGTNGNFYGTTAYGGNLNLNFGLGVGTVFKITPAGVLSTLVSFNGTHGSYGVGGLMQGGDGNFYGTTDAGGPGGCGMVFKLSPAGVTTTLASFNGADGSNPQGPLAEGSDGNFYGTAEYGGAGGSGTVFQMTPAGVLTTLVAFGAQTNAP